LGLSKNAVVEEFDVSGVEDDEEEDKKS